MSTSLNHSKFDLPPKSPNSMSLENPSQHPLPLPLPKLTLGCPILNRLLRGGIPCNTVTELVAESGTGKTQLCLQLLLTAQYPPARGGLLGSSLYLHSEFPFPSRRLHQLSLSHPSLPDPLHHILVHSLYSPHHLLDLLPLLDRVLERNQAPPRMRVRLLVIDSIAALFRSEFGNNREDLLERSRLFFKIAGELKRQAVKYGLAVVVTNQVGDVVETNVGNSECLVSSGRRVAPALGLAWTHCVNIRLFMWREDQLTEGEGESLQFETRRFIRVVFAPHLPDSCCQFVIKREGLTGIDG